MKLRGLVLFSLSTIIGWSTLGASQRSLSSAPIGSLPLPVLNTLSVEGENRDADLTPLELMRGLSEPSLSQDWSEALSPVDEVETINSGGFEETLQGTTEAGFSLQSPAKGSETL